ncbi:hypothetical protein [Dyadobacter fanqingshengii]|uniref:ASCH domain-containing protein n=1 Tax=Dyadobacter fanqingshengii TaxID=2906443 RepID=A0A9X1TAD4_9BACT|nr:hypothetical protein [Dyadobacter fanqingshengii]MCF0040834.1 hypothetical protein [Dyadobacter fanqingshengii]USJ37432.1 hypothetical protein NFI81_06540 [Dyadobacter fanqingshengii]
MLIKQKHLEGIMSGDISLAFRKWKNLSVKKDSLLKTSIGVVKIMDITQTELDQISEDDAKQAGYENVNALIGELEKTVNGAIYKIQLSYHSPDPRIDLRQKSQIPDEELEALKEKLLNLDKYSNQGKWTTKVLKAIRENPKLPAVELAAKVNKEKEWLKVNVRKLKNLGLTISHEPGYTLSPLGEYVLNSLPQQPQKGSGI